VRQKGVPAGPPLVAPGPSEMPITPVNAADTAADMLVRTFDAEQYAALSKLSEIVAPSQEDVPGAREADVAAFLDFLIGQSPEKETQLYKQGLEQLNAESRRRYGKTCCHPGHYRRRLAAHSHFAPKPSSTVSSTITSECDAVQCKLKALSA
jgi:hypothetical protein